MGTNLITGVKDLHSVTVKEEVKEDTIEWKDTLCSWAGRVNIVVSSLSKTLYRFSTTTVKTPIAFFTEIKDADICMEPYKMLK